MFKKWKELQRFILNGHKPKKVERELIKAAKEFLPYPLFWEGGLCLCGAPYGNYRWAFAVEIEQEKQWNYPEFQEGYRFGLDPEKPYRDANPYEEASRRRSWDRGYILGLSEKTVSVLNRKEEDEIPILDGSERLH